MKITIVLTLLSLCIYSCNNKTPDKDITQQTSKDSLLKKSIYEQDINEHLKNSRVYYNKGDTNKISLEFNIDTTGYILNSIIVYKSDRKYQVIKANKIIQAPDFRLIDWNFDGYKDITVLSNCGSGGCAYWIWNYSDKTKKYYYNKELSEILGLEIDSLAESIVVHYRGGFSIELWDTLKYIDKKLTLINGLTVERGVADSDNIYLKRTHRRLVDNVLVTKVDSPVIVNKKTIF